MPLRYVRESKYSLSLRVAKHELGCMSNRESAIKQHAKSTDHNIHPRDTHILQHGVNNYHKRPLVESWLSSLDSAAIKKKKPLPHAYLMLT